MVEGEQDGVADFKFLGHFGADGLDISCTCDNNKICQHQSARQTEQHEPPPSGLGMLNESHV